jgi:hypothetical protein
MEYRHAFAAPIDAVEQATALSYTCTCAASPESILARFSALLADVLLLAGMLGGNLVPGNQMQNGWSG